VGVWIGSKNLYAVAEDAVGFMLTLNLQYFQTVSLAVSVEGDWTAEP
jgi:hypothetical protein